MDVRYPSSRERSKTTAIFFASYFAVLGVVMPFLGPYLAQRGVGAVGVGLHMLVAVAAAAAVTVADDPLAIGALFFLVGVGYGTVLPLVEATVLERASEGSYGALRLWGSVGFVIAALGSGLLISGEAVRSFPTLLAGMLALLALACLPFETDARPPRGAPRQPLSGQLWLLLALLTANQVSHGPYYAFFSIHMEAVGASSLTVGGLWSVAVLAELTAFLAGRRLQRRWSLEGILAVSLAVTPLRWLLLALPPAMPVVVVSQLGHAASFALVHLAGVQLAQRLAPKGAARTAQSLYSGLVFGLGIVAGSALAGPIYGAFGGRGTFATAAVLAILVSVVFLFSRKSIFSDFSSSKN